MLTKTLDQQRHKVILRLLAESNIPVRLQDSTSINGDALRQLSEHSFIDSSDAGYSVTDKGLSYLIALESCTLFDPEKWIEYPRYAIWYLLFGNEREAIPHCAAVLSQVFNQELLELLRKSSSGYADAITHIHDINATQIINADSSLTKVKDDGSVVGISIQLSPVGKDAFDKIMKRMKAKELQTSKHAGVASKAMVIEWALIVAASTLSE